MAVLTIVVLSHDCRSPSLLGFGRPRRRVFQRSAAAGRTGMGGGTLVPEAKLSYDGCNSDDEERCRGASLDVNHA